MKVMFSLLILLIIPEFLLSQQKDEFDFMSEWDKYKKQESPYVDTVVIEMENLFEIEMLKELQLGNLKYRREKHSLGYNILGAAILTATVVKEWTLYNNSIHDDPARFFVDGYKNKRHEFIFKE